MNDYNFGNFLCMLRESKGMTQADIADILGEIEKFAKEHEITFTKEQYSLFSE